jgi:hypothetical protein
VLRILALCLALAGLACATSKEPVMATEETAVETFRARVAAVDATTRVVTLVNAEGDQVTFRADEAVQNLPQVNVGDEVVGQLMESLAIEVRPATKEEKAAPDTITEAAARAEPGQKPAGLFVRQIKALYTIGSIDKAAGGGTLVDADGDSHFVKVRDPGVLDRVKVGDNVVVTLTEALRVEVIGE